VRVPTVGPAGAKIFLLGEAPGKDEDLLCQPFVGLAGKTLNWLLSQAGISRVECLIGNVAKERPPGNKISTYYEDKKCTIPKPELRMWVEELRKELLFHKPNVIVALGSTALYTLTGNKAISKHRGYICESTLVPGLKVLPTYHPQNIQYEWKNFFPTVMDLRKAKRHSEFPEIPPDTRILMYDASKGDFINYCRDILEDEEKKRVCIDIETTIGNCPHVTTFGIAHSRSFGMSINIVKGKYACFPENDEIELWKWITRICEEKEVIIQNATFDTGVVLMNHGIFIRKLWMDTLIGAHCVWPELPRDLGFLTSLCLDVPEWKSRSSENKSYYNVQDCVNTFGDAEVLDREIDKQGVRNTFLFEMSQIPVALMMQLQGIDQNQEEKKILLDECNSKITTTGDTLRSIFGKEINYASPQQLQKLLYMDLKLPVQFQRRKHASDPRVMTADAKALRRLARMYPDNPALNLILEHKKFLTLRKFASVNPSPKGTVHASYNITGSSTEDEGKKSFGRWSSSGSIIIPYPKKMNLQNIPPRARRMYGKKEGTWIIQGDLVQAEAVVVAYLIDDQKLKAAFTKSFGLRGDARIPYDIHRITAVDMGMAGDVFSVTKAQRDIGKTVRHACVDEDTEVLTHHGWKRIAEFNKEIDEVAQWDTDGRISFVTPIETVKYEFDGELYNYRNTCFRQTISPGHRMIVVNRKTNKSKVILIEDLWDVNNSDYVAPTSGKLKSTTSLSLSPIFMRLFTAIQADGSFRERDRGRREISFKVKKERKIVRLRELLESAEIEYSEYPAGDEVGFYINGNRHKELFDFLVTTNKKFGSWVLWLSQDCLEAIIDESKWWDSRRNIGLNSWQYYSKYRENCEWMATIAHLTNRRASIYNDHPTVFTTNINDIAVAHFDKASKFKSQYKGYVYSMQVPSTFYLIRKDGIISITGNTNYSAGPVVIQDKLGCTLSIAKHYLEVFHNRCPKLKIWHNQIQEQLQVNRVMENCLGRKHRFLERWGDSLLRSAYSYKPQSTVGDLLNMALVELYTVHGDWLEIILQLHDAIYVRVYKEELIPLAMAAMRQAMVRTIEVNRELMTIDVDFKVGPSWGEQEEVDDIKILKEARYEPITMGHRQ
jgi:DNA polymerase